MKARDERMNTSLYILNITLLIQDWNKPISAICPYISRISFMFSEIAGYMLQKRKEDRKDGDRNEWETGGNTRWRSQHLLVW